MMTPSEKLERWRAYAAAALGGLIAQREPVDNSPMPEGIWDESVVRELCGNAAAIATRMCEVEDTQGFGHYT